MDNNAMALKIAAKMRKLHKKHKGDEDLAALCALLTEVVESGAAGLSPATVETVIEPKEDQ